MNVKDMNKNKQSTFILIAILILMALFIGCALQGAPGVQGTAGPQGAPGPTILPDAPGTTPLGGAARVGSVYKFGVNEQPISLFTFDNTLYMEGFYSSGIYTVDTTSGIATWIGNRHSFFEGGFAPQGFAAIDDTLYAVGSVDRGANSALYTFNFTTRVAVQVGTATNFGLAELSLSPNVLAALDDDLYMVGSAANNSALYTVDATTGMATQIGTATQFGLDDEASLTGLASVNGTLYGLFRSGLYSLNTTTGIASRVGNVVGFGVNEWGSQGLAAIDDTLYMGGLSGDTLYTLKYQ